MSEVWLGLMSGTSVDAIDAVAIRATAADARPELLAHVQHPWPTGLQQRLQALPRMQQGCDWAEWLRLDKAVAEEHARAVQRLREQCPEAAQARALGFHGQTLYHAPDDGNTLQIGSGAHLAAACGLDVIADFRRADMAAGGQGAPLACVLHAPLFGQLAERVAVLNLGGIANATLIERGDTRAGFDTGPANGLMDAWCQHHWQVAFDADGARARQGRLLPELLAACLAEPYFARSGPRSTGREYFHLDWLAPHLRGDEDPLDVLRTLLALTVRSVADALAAHGPQCVVLVGGGSRNSLLREELAAALAPARLLDSGAQGWPAEAIEAGSFAWMAMRHCAGLPANLPAVTGARRAVCLGARYPAPA